jgi:DNA-binding NarL/FixJ family response regulator
MASGATVLIVARDGFLRSGLEALLGSIGRIERVQVADSRPAALKSIASQPPVLVMLAGGPPDQLWPVVWEIKALAPQTRCVVLVEDVAQQRAAGAAQADAVLLQGTSPEELVAAVERLLI